MTRHLAGILCGLLTGGCLGVHAAEPTVPHPSAVSLEERTRRDQLRIHQWEEEDRRTEKRDAWELPVVAVLLTAGAAFASRNMVYAYSASFAAATGLTIHFYTSAR